jgi:hypothetical protein
MSLEIAQSHAWNLARTLMTCIVVVRIGDHLFGVVESREFDGDAASIIHEYDPFAR